MKPKTLLFSSRLTAATLLSFAACAPAATLTWNGAPGGFWDNSSADWLNGASPAVWDSSLPDSAVFGPTGAGTVNLGSGIIVEALSFTAPGYTLTGSPLTISNTGYITGTADATIASVVSGTSGLYKEGTGAVTLTGVNNYGGPTTIVEGTLRLGDGIIQPTLHSTYSISPGATLRVQYNATTGVSTTSPAVAAAWTGTQWSKFSGAGTLALATGKNNDSNWAPTAPTLPASFTGTLQIEGGRIATSFAGDHGLGGTTAIVVKPGGQLGMWNAGTYTQNFTISGTGYGEAGFQAALRLSNTATATVLTGTVTLDGNATIGASGAGTLSNSIGETTPSGLTLGTSSMGGTIVLAGANTYSGPTTLDFGTARFASRLSLYNGDTAQWTDTNLIFKSPTTAVFNVGGTDQFTASDLDIIKGLGSATGGFLSGTTISLDSSSATAPFDYPSNLSNPNGGSNTLSFDKRGTGTVVLSGSNSYTGKTTVTAGTLLFATPAALYNGVTTSWNTTNLNFLSGGTAAFKVGGPGQFTAGNIDTLRVLGSATGGFRANSLIGLDTTDATGGTFTYPAFTNAGTNALGLVKLGSGTLALTGTSTYTGGTNVTQGTLSFSGAAAYSSTTGNALALGTASGSRAVLNVASTGNFNYYTTVNVGGTGASANGAGVFNQSSGTVNLMNNTGFLQLGNGGYGSYVLSGGTLNFASASGIRVGDNTGGVGVYHQSGGTANLNRFFVVGGNSGTAPVGVATLTGGTLTGATGFHFILGNAGTASGVLNVGTAAGGAGLLVSRNAAGIRMGDSANAGSPTGILNLNSGTIQFTAGSINKVNNTGGPTTGIVNFNGGTLQANTANLTLVDNTPTSVNLFNGGLNVDTQTHNATISANLLATSGSGVYPVGGTLTVPAGGDGYIGAPVVSVTTNGAGTGATAIANVAAGVVTGVTLTSPGQGYAEGDTLSFAFTGGGSTTAATPYDHTLTAGDLAANGSGGLVKTGSGILTLTGASSYGGATSINAGTLALGTTSSLVNSPLLVKTSTALQVNSPGKTLAAVEVDPGSTLVLPVGGTATQVAGALTLNSTPSFTVRPLFTSPPAVGNYDLLVPAGVSGSAGVITTDLASLGVSRVAGTAALSGGKLVLQITNPGANLTWANTTASGRWNFNTDANFTGASPGTFLNLDSVTFGDTAAGTITLEGTLTPSLVTVDSSANYTFAGSGVIGGTAGLIKDGGGTLILSGSHSYTGTTAINGGIVTIGTIAANGINSPIGAGDSITMDGGLLRYTGGSYGGDGGPRFDRSIAVGSGGGTLDIAGAGIVFSSSTFTGSGQFNLVDSSGDANNRQLLYAGNSPAFDGTLVIGNGTPNSGWMQYRSNAPSPFGTAVITINTGGIFTADNGATAPTTLSNAIVLNGGLLGTQIPNLNFTGPVTAGPGSTSTVGTSSGASGDVTLSGNLDGSGTVFTLGTAGRSVRLAGSNGSFTGIWRSTSAQTVFNSASSGSAGAAWVANGSNFIGNIPGGGSVSLGELSGTVGTVRNDVTGSTFIVSTGALGTDSTFAGGIIDKAGDSTSKTGITKVGGGILTLTGSLAYTGPTTVSAGTLVVPATNSAVLSESTTVADGATLAVTGASGTIWQTAALTLGSGGATTLSLRNLTADTTRARLGVTGSLAINGPVTLNLGGVVGLGTYRLIEYPFGSPIDLEDFTVTGLPRGIDAELFDNTANGSIDLVVNSVADLVWKGNNGPLWDVNATTNWLLAAVAEKYLESDRVLFNDSATGPGDVILDELVLPGAVTFDNASKEYSLTGVGGIGGTIGLTKSNIGTATIATTNTYTGATTVSGGILQLGDGLNNGVIAGPLVNNAEVVLNPGFTQTYAGAISGSGTLLTKFGPETFVLTGTTNTFAGTVSVEGGTLQIGNGTTNGSFGTPTYTVAETARLHLNYATAVQSTSAAPFTAKVTGAGTLELNSAQLINGSANWGANTPTPIVEPFSSAFTGTLILGKGRLDVSATGAGGMSKLVVRAGGQFMTWSGDFTMPAEIAGLGWGEAGGATGYPGAIRVAAGSTATWSGPITLTANSGIMAQTDSSLLVTGSITGPYQCDFFVGSQFNNTGTLTVAPAIAEQNSYGSTRIYGSGLGTSSVVAGNQYAFSTGGLIVNGTILKLNGFDFTFANLVSTGTGIALGRVGNYGTDPSVLTVGTDGTSTTFVSVLEDGGTGTLGLVKTGTGTLTLTGVNTYTGGTTIQSGGLQIGNGTANGTLPGDVLNSGTLTFSNGSAATYSGAISGSGALVKSGAGTLTLSGTNSYTGNTTVSAGILSISSPYLADTSTVTIAAGSRIDLNTAAALDTVGTLVLGPTTVPAGTYNSSHPTFGSFFTGTGSLVVGGGYNSWKTDPTNGLTAGVNDAPENDPDFDGVSNLLEYVLGGLPLQPNPGILPTASISGSFLVLSYKRSDASESDTVQTGTWSTNLGTWSSPLTPQLVNENGSAPDDMQIRIPLANQLNGRLFGRLNVTN